MRTYALLGEIEEDPGVPSPAEGLDRLRALLDEVNRDHASSLAAPVAIVGDVPEFGAVLRDLAPVYPLARTLAEAFFPLAVRMAVAEGEIPLPVESPLSPDGPAFDLAAELLYRVRKEDRLLLVRTERGDRDTLVNALVLVLHHDLQHWTRRQVDVVRLYRRYGRQQTVGEQLRISQQAVSGALAVVGWKVLAEAEGALRSQFPPGRPEP